MAIVKICASGIWRMTSSLLVKPYVATDAEGTVFHITPSGVGWQYTGFDLHRISAGQTLTRRNDGIECCAVVISGSARFKTAGAPDQSTGHRGSPFDHNVWAFYTSAGAEWRVTALESLEVAFCTAPGWTARPARMIGPSDVRREVRGDSGNLRTVADILPQDIDVADSLLVLEAWTPPSNWSSYPPHKHDEDDLPHESKLEEVYYHRINPPSGFAIQRIYTKDRSIDETLAVTDGDVVLVPRGYHPVGAPYGYDLYYLNVMAGPKRVWRTRPDPDHEWLLNRRKDVPLGTADLASEP